MLEAHRFGGVQFRFAFGDQRRRIDANERFVAQLDQTFRHAARRHIGELVGIEYLDLHRIRIEESSPHDGAIFFVPLTMKPTILYSG